MDRARNFGAALISALLLAAGIAAPSFAGEHYPVPPSNSYTVLYRGNGHGHGLSQYGARGAALQGLSYGQILGFYYQGTALGLKSSTGQIRVRIDTSPSYPTVPAQSGLRIGSSALTTSGVDLWRLAPGGGGFVLQGRVSGVWHNDRIVSTSAGFSNTSGAVAVYGLNTYRGTVYGVRVSTSASSTGVITINTLPVEAYLRGVVPSEMPSSWPAAAVQAQAVAARSYAWYAILHSAGNSYDICATTNCQVYRGYSGEQAGSNDAIARTPGVVVAYNNSVAFAQFSASNGGITSDDGERTRTSSPRPTPTTRRPAVIRTWEPPRRFRLHRSRVITGCPR